MSNQSRSPSEHSEAERAKFEAWAISNGLAYQDKQYGLCFYDSGAKHYAWVGWEARADLQRKAEALLAKMGNPESLATPAEAGERTLPIIDTPEFRELLAAFKNSALGHDYNDTVKALIAHINAYGQQCARYAVQEDRKTQKGTVTDYGAMIDLGESFPELPEPAHELQSVARTDAFTAEQMFEYGEKCARFKLGEVYRIAVKEKEHIAEMAQWARESGLNVPPQWEAEAAHHTDKGD